MIRPGEDSQASRILSRLLQSPGEFVNAAELSRIGSGKESGWCASFTKRISELRAAKYVVEESEERVQGQRRTFYRLAPDQTELELRVA